MWRARERSEARNEKKEREGLGWTRLGRHRSCLSAATFVVVLNVLFVKKV
jgi:hypothetical protein